MQNFLFQDSHLIRHLLYPYLHIGHSRVDAKKSSSAPIWSTGRVLALAAVTAISTYALATFRSEQQNLDYARPDKFPIPKYGNMDDMEKVGLSSFSEGRLLTKAGSRGNTKSGF